MSELSLRAMVITGLAIAMFACSKPTDIPAASQNSDTAKVAFNADEFRKLESRVSDIESKNILSEFSSEMDSIAHLKVSEQTYSGIKYDLGYVTVSISNVKEYANESQVVLTFGNPGSADLVDVAVDLEWGSADENGNPAEKVYRKNEAFTTAIRAGTWNNYTINLSDVSPKELSYVRVRNFTHKSIRLRDSN